MRRGELWTVSASGYSGKPRPAVIIQSDEFSETVSITICPTTTDETDVPHMRVLVDPSPANGLRQSSRLMVDKVMTVPKSRIGARIGRLDEPDQARLDETLLLFLGLT